MSYLSVAHLEKRFGGTGCCGMSALPGGGATLSVIGLLRQRKNHPAAVPELS